LSADLDERLIGLLRSREMLTARAAADELQVSLRTVRRALARLSASGVHIETSAGRGGGMRLVGPTGLRQLRLEHGEVLDVLLALALAESLRSPVLLGSVRAVRQKLALALPEPQRKTIASLRRRVLIGAPASPTVRESLRDIRPGVAAALQRAFLSQTRLMLTYRDGAARATQREIEPHYLLLNHPAWYVLAFDCEKQAGRHFRLDRVEGVRESVERFALKPVERLLADVSTLFFAI
jgi:predicted DNA-binding transcriptional regulator YafY